MEYKTGDTILDRYEVVEVKRGGFGVVYISRDLEIGIGVAIKSFQDRFFSTREVASAFYHEAEVWMRLGVHENIVTALYVTYVDEKPHVWLEYVDGGSLRDWIRDERLDTVRSLRLGIQFCNGMIHANNVDLGGGKRGIVHRDIDPKNILLTKEGLLKVTDFGLVKALGGWAPLKVAGKPPYMSPEQFFIGVDLDSRSDIYSFGGVLYEILTGGPPFYNPDWSWENYERAHLSKTPTPLREIDASIPSDLERLVLKCLKKRPIDRHQTFEDVRKDLERIDRELFGGRAQETVIPMLPPGSKLLVVPRVHAWTMKGFSFESLGKFDSALECFNTALKLDPPDSLAWTGKGIVLKDLGEYMNAIKCFEEALKIQPRDNLALTHKGLSLFWMGKPRDALEFFDKALEVNENDSDAWNGKGISLLELGYAVDAMKCFESALQANPNNADAWYNLGLISYRRGDYSGALKHFEMVLKIDPRRADALNSRGGCLIQMGKVGEALKAFEEALNIDPDNERYKANREVALRLLRR